MPIYVRVYFQCNIMFNKYIHTFIYSLHYCLVEYVDITGTIISGWWSITRCLFLKLPNLVLVFSLSWNKYR